MEELLLGELQFFGEAVLQVLVEAWFEVGIRGFVAPWSS